MRPAFSTLTVLAAAMWLPVSLAPGLAAQAPLAIEDSVPAAAPEALNPVAPKAAGPVAPAPSTRITPNGARIVTIGAIDKRTGVTKTYAGKPGQMFKFGALTVTIRTCETTPPWEQKLTGAFLLIDEATGKTAAHRIYSGWMFVESPSLHPLEHARYDIWVKSCTMRFPDTGPDTVLAGSVGGGNSDDKPKASKAKKSAEMPIAAAN